MKISLNKIIFAFLLLLLIYILVNINITTFRNIPNVVEFHAQNPDIEQLLQRDIESYKAENEEMLTICAVKQKNISTLSGGIEPVIAVYTDKFYKELYPIEMLSGNFLTNDGGIVVSDALAQELFHTREAVGYQALIGEESYSIIGVYKEDKSPMAQSFGNKRVFLPISSEMEIDVISLGGNYTANYYRSLFSKDGAYKMSGYSDVNILQEANMIKLLNRILLLLTSVFFLIKMSVICRNRYHRIRISVQASLENHYAFQAIRCNHKQIFGFILPVCICAAIIIVILMAVASPLPLPLDVIPSNLFDLPAYYDILVGRIAKPNTFLYPHAAYYLRYSQASLLLYILTIAAAPFVFLILAKRDKNSCLVEDGEKS